MPLATEHGFQLLDRQCAHGLLAAVAQPYFAQTRMTLSPEEQKFLPPHCKMETMTVNSLMLAQITTKSGFIAALDQSGGSTPNALRQYGFTERDYHGDDEMFRLMHEMRVRIMSSPSFTGDNVIGAILFKSTMEGEAKGNSVPSFLWEERGVVPFLKIDQGLERQADGVQLMKPIEELDALLERAVAKKIFGTKMRSVIFEADHKGIAAIVSQQFAYARKILTKGLVPIVEPEISIGSASKKESEAILRTELLRHLDTLSSDQQVMVKLTIPSVPDFFVPLSEHPAVGRVVALSGGYSRSDACDKLRQNHRMIASFSRALTQDVRHHMSDTDFDSSLRKSIEEIFAASVVKNQ